MIKRSSLDYAAAFVREARGAARRLGGTAMVGRILPEIADRKSAS